MTGHLSIPPAARSEPPAPSSSAGRGGSRRGRNVSSVSYPSVVSEIDALRQRGYAADVSVIAGGRLRFGCCGDAHHASEAIIESTARFEGASNPDDQAIVFGIRCRACDRRGVLVSAYGPTATAVEAEVMVALGPPSRE